MDGGGGEGKREKRKNMRKKWPARTCMVREHGTRRGYAEKEKSWKGLWDIQELERECMNKFHIASPF